MIPSANPGRAVAALALAALLCGCISVFPKAAPEQLYRFGDIPAPKTLTTSGGDGFAVGVLPTSFDRPAAGDAILTLSQSEAAYIKGSRWVGPAQTLFESAVTRAFESARAARLIARGEASRADYLLKLDVRRFEARYEQGRVAPPTIEIEVYAALSRASDHSLAGERLFDVHVAADANRAGAIVSAFDEATRQVLIALVAWVDAKGAG